MRLYLKSHSYFESFPYKFRQIVENSNNKAILAFQKELWTNTSNINKYIKGLISDKYRIACFSAYMWNSKNMSNQCGHIMLRVIEDFVSNMTFLHYLMTRLWIKIFLIYILWERQMNIYYHQNNGQ